MSNTTEFLIQEAYRFAKEGKISEAHTILGMLHIYDVKSVEIAELRKDIGIAYLKACDRPVHFGVVQYLGFRIFTIPSIKEDHLEFIGLSPFARPFFEVKNPTYNKHGNHEVLFKVDDIWVYGIFQEDSDSCFGQVVSVYKGRLRVIPLFANAKIEHLARKLLKSIQKDSLIWGLPDDFFMAPEEYEATRKSQTRLALAYYGITPKENDDE